MKIELTVVEENGSLFFKTTRGTLFDCLTTFVFFDGGKLLVKRNGEVFDETTGIYEVGTHAATICFIGLKKLGSGAYASERLPASLFQKDDAIEIETHANLPPHFDLGQYIGKFNRAVDAAHQVLQGHPQGMSLGEFDAEMKKRS